MKLKEVKQKIDVWHRADLSREDTVTLVSNLPINSGDEAKAFEYVDIVYQTHLTLEAKYITLDKKGNPTLDLAHLANDLLSEYHFATFRDTEETLIYKDGVYQSNGVRFIKSECQHRVGVTALLTEHKVNEVIGHIKRSTYVDRETFNCGKKIINIKNGLLNIETSELRVHTPEFLSTVQIPVNYNPGAKCPKIRKFLKDIHKPEDIPVILEFIGYCLIPDNTIQKAILCVGDGDNGKSTELNLIKAFIGKDNCSNVSWHKLETNRFAISALEGKLVNIFADLPSQSLNMTTSFKMLTGGDTIGSEKKFQDHYSFVNFARLIFSTNKPPKIYDEDSHAFWRRWIIIDFPNQFTEEQKDKQILDKLTTDNELSGLLNLALEGLSTLLKYQNYSYSKTVEETTEFYLRAADPVYAFIQDCCEVESTMCVSKDELYDLFREYCGTNTIPALKPNAFARALQNQTMIRVRAIRPVIDGKRVTAWEGIKPVRDVRDSSVFSNTFPRERNNHIKNSKEKNPTNPDNPDGKRQSTSDTRPTNNEIPDYPTQPCQCGCGDYWLTDDNRWLCSKCHPKPVEGENQ